jgi:hypothetical protein
LGHLPLGLAQASWVIISQGLTYQVYLEKLHQQPIDELLLRDAADEYQLTVVQAISLALDDLNRRGETAARRLLELLCLLSADGVPRRYLADIPKAGFDQSRNIALGDPPGAEKHRPRVSGWELLADGRVGVPGAEKYRPRVSYRELLADGWVEVSDAVLEAPTHIPVVSHGTKEGEWVENPAQE